MQACSTELAFTESALRRPSRFESDTERILGVPNCTAADYALIPLLLLQAERTVQSHTTYTWIRS